jgi:ABC-type nitrate/sulfonate/bicarbonate transport system substrate-binding protein
VITRRRALGAGGSALSLLALPGCARHGASRQPLGAAITNGISGLVVQELARSQGYLAQLGVERKVLVVSDGSKCVAALVSGAAKICVGTGFNQLPPAIANGARLKIIAGAMNLCSLAMFSAKPDIHRVEDLAGKTIGIGAIGAVVHQTTIILLKKKGVDVNTVHFRNVGSAADIFKAVAAGTVDAGFADVDIFDEQQKFGVHALSDGLLWKELPDYTNQATYSSDDAIRRDRDSLVRLLAAYGKVYRFISSPGSRAAYLQAWRRVSGHPDPTEAATQWNWIQQNQPYDTGMILTDARLDLVQRMNVAFGAQQTVLPIAEIADMSLAKDALRLMG